MFRYQADAQNARELARHYLATIGMRGTPSEYFNALKKMEKEFLHLLREAHKTT